MCVAPNTLPGGTLIACRQCWQCRERAVDDWVGRNIAESKTAMACHAVTLTYGYGQDGDADHVRAAILTYSDVQKYLKLLRRHGYPVRYFVTGEYGSKKGRAHWHVMLYWQRAVPEHVLDERFMEAHWPHGLSFWTRPTAHAIRYNCKYLQKSMGDVMLQGHLSMSKKPPLGAVFFAQRAEQYARQRLSPQTLEYSFPEVRRRKRDGSQEIVKFMLTGRSAELFLEHFVRSWEAMYGRERWPASDLVDLYVEYGKVVTDEARMPDRSGLEWKYLEMERERDVKARQRQAIEEQRRERERYYAELRGEYAERSAEYARKGVSVTVPAPVEPAKRSGAGL